MCLLDALTSQIVGAQLPPGRLAGRFAIETGGVAEATIVGAARQVPATLAAMANATAAHSDEIDDVHATRTHAGAAIVPTVLATAERNRANGRETLNAIVLGYDLGTRVVDALGGQRALLTERHIHAMSFLVFGAAAAAARLLRLSPLRHQYAAALAAPHAGAIAAYAGELNHFSKALNVGSVAYSGTQAAILASMGFEGTTSVFEGKHGVFASWGTPARPEQLERGLGDEFAIVRTSFKFYSAGHPIHAPVHGVLTIMREHDLKPEQLGRIRLAMATHGASLVDNRASTTICVQDMVAIAAMRGRLGVREAHDELALRNPMVRRLRESVLIERSVERDALDPDSFGAGVTLETRDGRSFSVEIAYPPGDYRASDTSWTRLVDKFHDECRDFIDEPTANEIVELVARIDDVDDIATLTSLLRRTKSGSPPLH
jgi:2-methylcitrate dehydratase PrpD